MSLSQETVSKEKVESCVKPLTSERAKVSSGGARLFPGGRMVCLGGPWGEASASRTQAEVLISCAVV